MSVHNCKLNRRAVLRLGVLAAVIGVPDLLYAQPLQRPAEAVGGRLFRDVQIDSSPIAARGLPNYAVRVAQTVRAAALQTFADRITGDRRAPTLVLRIDSVELAANGGMERRHHGGDDEHDFIEGIGLIVAPNGRVLVQQPLLTSLPSGSSGPWYAAGTDDRRLEALGGQFSQWMRRQLGI